ncbi:hypothetical protein ACLESO_14945 [Pyxidicoccus sp. 3LG]
MDRARGYAVDDARAVASYVDAVYQAIVGLEAEYDRLLMRAKNCDLQNLEEVASVIREIDAYLMGENLRPLLTRAAAGLQQCRESLQKFADRFLQLPSRRVERQEALRALESLLWDLKNFLDVLESKSWRVDEMALSGVGIVSLLEIRRYLEGAREEKGKIYRFHGETDDGFILVRMINEAQMNRGKNEYLAAIANLEAVARRVVHEFR